MADQITLELHNRPQAWALMQSQMHPFLASVLQGGGRWVLTVRKMKRTQAQNRRYWGQGVLAQVAAQATVNGRLYSAEVWHEQFKRQFIGVDELPNGQVIGKSSTKLTTAILWCLPIIVSASQSPTRLRVSTTSGRASIDSRSGITPRLSNLP